MLKGELSLSKILIYDSTLRDGAQAQGISFSVEDKLKIVSKLDKLGINYIEAGNPGSNPKDIEFFERIKKIQLKTAKLAAFGSTRRAGINAKDDANIQSLLKAETPVVTIFGKSWDFHVLEVLRTTLDENINMIKDTIKFFKEQGKEVIFDAEHFFDGYRVNPEYAIKTLKAAAESGAEGIVLCDTNGGNFPDRIVEVTKLVKDLMGGIDIGIHCHNDTGMADANSIMAIKAGAVQVQGTINGFGERCGNANLITIIPNLQLKMGYQCIPEENIEKITTTARFINEIANIIHNERAPYVGNCAFAHKGGMHIDAVMKNTASFEHINPCIIGNERRVLMSEVSGRSTIISAIKEVDPEISKDSPEAKRIIDKLKQLEHEGYQFEGAESSFELVIRKELGKYINFFELEDFKVIITDPDKENLSASAMIKIKVGDLDEITAAEGDGPVNALDKALRKALEVFYPELSKMRLTDFKVRVLDSESATAAKVRVWIESTDGENSWSTVGVSTNVINASWKALVDSVQYMLTKNQLKVKN